MELARVLLVGIGATALMSLSLYLIHWSGFANGDMVRALGSLATRRYENSLAVGWVIHFSAGALFSVLYVLAWGMTGFPAATLGVPICTVFGLFHGVVVSLLLVVIIAEHHPLERFQEAGLRVAITHIAAHVVYGFVVGVGVSVWDLSL
jgi:hypothetical protein